MQGVAELEGALSEAYRRLENLHLPKSETKPGLQRAGGHRLGGSAKTDSYISYKTANRESVWLSVRAARGEQEPFLVLTRKRRGERQTTPVVSVDRMPSSAIGAAIEAFLAIAVLIEQAPGSWRLHDDARTTNGDELSLSQMERD